MRLRYIGVFIADFILLPVFVFCLFNASLVTYGLRMGKGQLDIVTGAREFAEVFADDTVDAKVKERLRLIEKIRQFAFDSIGLKPVDNYTTFYDQRGQRLMYVVTAAEPFELRAHIWHFPVVGDVPYKGFFDEEKAKEEYYRMRMLGMDADIGGAAGWSTLGWFQDPVLSSMLNRSEGDLAELIIHELTHGTIFVKDDVEYNENLAQFVGVEGAKWFLSVEFGTDSKELKHYLASMADDDIRTQFMLTQSKYLDSVYQSFGDEPLAWKEQQKRKAFIRIATRARSLKLEADPTFSQRIFSRMVRSGNTIFLQYIRYEAKGDDFSELFSEAGYDLRVFVRNMELQYGK